LKNALKSKWIISPIFEVKIKKNETIWGKSVGRCFCDIKFGQIEISLSGSRNFGAIARRRKENGCWKNRQIETLIWFNGCISHGWAPCATRLWVILKINRLHPNRKKPLYLDCVQLGKCQKVL